ncbi:MAG TPA: hypothetical protein VHN11_09490 [Xanthobacteraceae bacterium]|jgi:hypothetical protein|nr:hypothetical protein [Xanthobacteraceae bacterium]
MFQRSHRFLFASLPFLFFAPDTSAHESWISRGGLRNAAGEWCCGDGDCFIVPPENISLSSDGYRLFDAETVPFSEAQPSPDGAFWRCKRPDGSRRCFFAPPPGS